MVGKRDIEERWNKGRFGKDYEECDDLILKKNWDRWLERLHKFSETFKNFGS